MSDAGRREWRFYVNDMIGFAEKVVTYVEGFDQPRFVRSGLNYDAVLRNLELIGEAASHIPDSVREAFPQIPWRQLVATRNRLIHGYLVAALPAPLGRMVMLQNLLAQRLDFRMLARIMKGTRAGENGSDVFLELLSRAGVLQGSLANGWFHERAPLLEFAAGTDVVVTLVWSIRHGNREELVVP